MLDLPGGSEGLQWIVSQGPGQLLLIPGLHAASLAAAAAGSQAAISYIRFTAQHFVAFGGSQDLTPLDKVCLALTTNSGWRKQNKKEASQLAKDTKLRDVYAACQLNTKAILASAVENGQLDALKWLRVICHRPPSMGSSLMRVAAKAGNLAMLKLLRSGPNPVTWDIGVMRAALPHEDCVKWLLSQRPACPFSEEFLVQLIHKKKWNLLKWLRTNQQIPLACWSETVSCAMAGSGDVPMLQWLADQHPPVLWGPAVIRAAAMKGSISTLQWLRAHYPGDGWDADCSVAAVHSGNLAVLQWMRSQTPPVPWCEDIAAEAASLGDMSMLQWMRAQVPPCPWGRDATAAAADQGNLSMLAWMRTQDPSCSLDASCTGTAAFNGDMETLQWLAGQGCSLDSDLYYHAAVAFSPTHHMLQWLRSQQVPIPATVPTSGDLDTELRQAKGPVLMLLADIGAAIPDHSRPRLTAARRCFCTFHGLVRWIRCAASDPSRGAHKAFDHLCTDTSGQRLLHSLSMLAPELLSKIAVMAGLQHDLVW